jgi:hypothetical protein
MTAASTNSEHFMGFGLGLRPPHFDYILNQRPDVGWFEIISENFMVGGGKPKYFLQRIREHYPIVMHGVSLSIGSTDPLDIEYLKKLRTLAAEVEPAWISDHLCWTGIHGINSHDLLPLPYNEESLKHVIDRVSQVQDFMGRQILLENPSSYLDFKSSDISEVEFLKAVADGADCLILLDINNIYVSARNHGFDAVTYLNTIPQQRVRQFHLAGHSDYGDYVIDTHDHDIRNEVWELYRKALQRFGAVSTMIERDGNIPEFPLLEAELATARQIFDTFQSQTS